MTKIKGNSIIKDLIDENLFSNPLSESDRMKLIWGNWDYSEEGEVRKDDKTITQAGARGLLPEG